MSPTYFSEPAPCVASVNRNGGDGGDIAAAAARLASTAAAARTSAWGRFLGLRRKPGAAISRRLTAIKHSP